jgi:hypothetical protein
MGFEDSGDEQGIVEVDCAAETERWVNPTRVLVTANV